MAKNFYAVRLPDATRDALFETRRLLAERTLAKVGVAAEVSLHHVVGLALVALQRQLRQGALLEDNFAEMDRMIARHAPREPGALAPLPAPPTPKMPPAPVTAVLGYTDAERDAMIDARVAELTAQPDPPPKPRKRRGGT